MALEHNRYIMLLQMHYTIHNYAMYGNTQERYKAYWKYDTPLDIITNMRVSWDGRVVRAK